MTDLAPAGTAHEAGLAHAEGRELVVMHEALGFLDAKTVDALLVAGRAQGEERQHLRLTAREQAGAMRARSDLGVAVERADLVHATSIGTLLVDGDDPAHRLFLHRVEGLRQRGDLGRRVFSAFSRRPSRQDLLLDLGDGVRTLVLVEHVARLLDVAGETGLDLVHQRPVGQLLRELHLGRAHLGSPGADDFALLLDGLVSHFEPGQDVGLVDLFATGLDHADGLAGAGDHQVDRALVDLLIGGVDHPRAVRPWRPARPRQVPGTDPRRG